MLLANNQLTLNDIAFIGTNAGPGPFTTLRVAIATVNGISFANKIPLIAIDGLSVLLEECRSYNPNSITVALLNAFSGDLYYGISTGHTQKIACQNVATLFEEIHENFANQSITFCGNGALLYTAEITAIFKNLASITDQFQTPSLDGIANAAYQDWKLKGLNSTTSQIEPLYLKVAFKGV